MKVYIVGRHPVVYALPLMRHAGATLTDVLEDADVVLFTGGSDVDPSLYGENVGYRTSYDADRDVAEVALFNRAKELGKALVGVCRGAQMLTVMAGGKLIQDVTNHGTWSGHPVKTYDGKEIVVSSTHHQMCMPYGFVDNFKILMWAEGRSAHYLNGDDENWKPPIEPPAIFPEPEAMFYPDINAFCVQYHPEIMKDDSEGVAWFVKHVKLLLKGKLNELES